MKQNVLVYIILKQSYCVLISSATNHRSANEFPLCNNYVVANLVFIRETPILRESKLKMLLVPTQQKLVKLQRCKHDAT